MTRSTRLAAITMLTLTALSGVLVLAAGAPTKTPTTYETCNIACQYRAAFNSLKEN